MQIYCKLALHAEAETGFIATVPVVTVQVYISSQKYTNFVEIVTSAHTLIFIILSLSLFRNVGIIKEKEVSNSAGKAKICLLKPIVHTDRPS